MPSRQPLRLTKKQKKATAFREHGSNKAKGTDTGTGKGKLNNPAPGHPRSSAADTGEGEDDGDANAVPAMEDQDQALVEMAGDTEGIPKGGEGREVSVPKATVESTVTPKKNSKRRGSRDKDEAGQPAAKKARLARRSDGIHPPVAHEEDENEEIAMSAVKDGAGEQHGSVTKNKASKTQRQILFIGNLKYTTTREAIQSHFSLCDPPPTVRLLTPKVTRVGATVAKSKGCAFLEFSTGPALQAALRLHQSELDGRRINVELTAGGGGKGDGRLAKVKARNKQLMAQRARQNLKRQIAKGNDTNAVQHETLQPQRFSTTSGETNVPRTKRTWTVSDHDQGGGHRGGMRGQKKRGTGTKNWGTGVNALPIG